MAGLAQSGGPAGPGAQWLDELSRRAWTPPLAAREPLLVRDAGAWVEVGSVEPALALMFDGSLAPVAAGSGRQWRLDGEPTQALNRLADQLRARGLAGAWRDEQLAVTDGGGRMVGTVERAAVRPLGIATRAVHLVGLRADGRMWAQQRSLTKANDPGLWDTLMGGMVGAKDTIASALERETWEEAGLRMDQFGVVTHGGQVRIRKPSAPESGVMGYMDERIDWYHAVLPASVEPRNQDGEVDHFDAIDSACLVQRLQEGLFTLEAALVLAAFHGWTSAVTGRQ